MSEDRKIVRWTLLVEWDNGHEEDVSNEVYLRGIENELDMIEADRNSDSDWDEESEDEDE